MKKLFFSVAFMMAASAMFAQTTLWDNNPFFNSSTYQWASQVIQVSAPAESSCEGCTIPQIARVTYNGLNTENMNLINQTGDYNYANVFQTGSQNYSVINQDGNDVFLGTGGTYNDAKVYQSGSMNYSDVKQEGDYNDSDVIQSGTSNYAKQDVGVGWAEYNKTYVRQFGNENASLQTQRGDGNDARVEQLTNNNEATQSQTSLDSHTTSGNIASIWQYGGNFNAALQVQTGEHNYGYAEQNGMGNKSSSIQIGNSGVGDGFYSNYASTLQVGNENSACIDQKASPTGANLSAIYQFGDSNKVGVTQDTNAIGYGNLSYISQYGNLNNACVTQINGTSGL